MTPISRVAEYLRPCSSLSHGVIRDFASIPLSSVSALSTMNQIHDVDRYHCLFVSSHIYRFGPRQAVMKAKASVFIRAALFVAVHGTFCT